MNQQRPQVPIYKNVAIWFMASMTLGLAPFFPEPHIWGKLKWVAGGAVGMQPMDWFDFIMHGSPWVMLFVSLFFKAKDKMASK